MKPLMSICAMITFFLVGTSAAVADTFSSGIPSGVAQYTPIPHEDVAGEVESPDSDINILDDDENTIFSCVTSACVGDGGVSPSKYLATSIMMNGSKTHVNVSSFTQRSTSFPHGKVRTSYIEPKSGWARQTDLDQHSGTTYKVILPNGRIVASVRSNGQVVRIRDTGKVVYSLK